MDFQYFLEYAFAGVGMTGEAPVVPVSPSRTGISPVWVAGSVVFGVAVLGRLIFLAFPSPNTGKRAPIIVFANVCQCLPMFDNVATMLLRCLPMFDNVTW